ncbi:MAG TPA: VCBS repeat-containing protein, partial [Acidobacteriota bacterium]
PPAALVLAELNHDGILDVITANAESQNLTILFGKGDGQFRAAGQPIPVPIKPHLIVVADFNGDQNEDVAVTAHDSNEVVILKGDNQGTFPASPVRYSFLKAEKAHNHGLAVADINRDGNPDLLTSNQDHNSVSALIGTGDGNFYPAPGSPFRVGRAPYPLSIFDFNKDGNLDIATPDVGGNTISLLLGDGKGNFAAAPGSPFPVAARPFFAASGDLNRDGHPDLVVTHDDRSQITVLLGDGLGGFQISFVDATANCWKTVLADMNGDQNTDIAMACSDNNVRILLGERTGVFRQNHMWSIKAGHGSWSLAVADVNRDGKPDVLTANSEDRSVTVLLQRAKSPS